jgi:hypothetical protein
MRDATADPINEGRLPVPGHGGIQRGYTRAIALESVRSGWAPLIHYLFDRIERRRDDQGRPTDWLPVRVAQVKEKLGGLRFYYDWVDDSTADGGDASAFRASVHLAEGMSFYLCEMCGALGRPRSGGWILTLCDTHAATRAAAALPSP